MPSFNTTLRNAMESSQDILVTMPGGGTLRAEFNLDVLDTLPDGSQVLYPIVISMENSSEDLLVNDQNVTVSDGVANIRDRGGRPLVLLLNVRKPLGQQDLIIKNA